MENEDNKQTGAVVFASSYTALGIVRSLGRQNVPVWVLGNKFSLASASRYAKRTIPIPAKDETEGRR